MDKIMDKITVVVDEQQEALDYEEIMEVRKL